jgi:MOSC domain-containing protein YiiM
MKVLSVNIGLPRIVEYRGEPVATGIYKESVAGRVTVNEFNLAGDAQADLTVHGGYAKAVYVYPSEHYEFWRKELQEMDLPFGVFGENSTTLGLTETDAHCRRPLRIGLRNSSLHSRASRVSNSAFVSVARTLSNDLRKAGAAAFTGD